LVGALLLGGVHGFLPAQLSHRKHSRAEDCDGNH
jgi:hypothetical protein